MKDVLDRPRDVAAFIVGPDGPYPVIRASVIEANTRCVILHVDFQPVAALRCLSFPDETVGIYVDRRRRVLAIPHNANARSWRHCNMPVGDLCLWYSRDPKGLQWRWTDGFEAYLGIVSRHLQAEEWYRRGNAWPFEDAPHGLGPPERPHPVRSAQMLAAAGKPR